METTVYKNAIVLLLILFFSPGKSSSQEPPSSSQSPTSNPPGISSVASPSSLHLPAPSVTQIENRLKSIICGKLSASQKALTDSCEPMFKDMIVRAAQQLVLDGATPDLISQAEANAQRIADAIIQQNLPDRSMQGTSKSGSNENNKINLWAIKLYLCPCYPFC